MCLTVRRATKGDGVQRAVHVHSKQTTNVCLWNGFVLFFIFFIFIPGTLSLPLSWSFYFVFGIFISEMYFGFYFSFWTLRFSPVDLTAQTSVFCMTVSWMFFCFVFNLWINIFHLMVWSHASSLHTHCFFSFPLWISPLWLIVMMLSLSSSQLTCRSCFTAENFYFFTCFSFFVMLLFTETGFILLISD